MRNGVAALAFLLAAGQAQAGEPGPRFRAPELVVAIVYDEFNLFRSADELTNAIRGRYFDGFAAILDRACRFLPPQSYETVRTRLDQAEAGARDAGVVASAAAAGIADGRLFADSFDCAHSKTVRAQRHLAGLLGVSATTPAPGPDRRPRDN